jgi:hypothetical protein
MRLAAAVAGDIGLTRTRVISELLEVTPSEVDIVAHIWKGASTVGELDCTLDSGGVIEIDFGDEYGWLATEATAGVWLLEYRCEFGDGDLLTVPAGWPDEIVIRDDHEPEIV